MRKRRLPDEQARFSAKTTFKRKTIDFQNTTKINTAHRLLYSHRL
jgi:hypothetical protein